MTASLAYNYVSSRNDIAIVRLAIRFAIKVNLYYHGRTSLVAITRLLWSTFMENLDDQELLRRIKQDDPLVLDDLWNKLFTYAWSFARRYDLDEQLAQDAASEALLTIRTSASQFQFRCSFRSYCWKIATSKVLDIVRKDLKRQKKQPASLDAGPRWLVRLIYKDHAEIEGIANASLSVDFETVHARLEPCMGRLDPRKRQVIEMIYFGEQTPHEVAHLLGIMRNNVNQIADRAREILRNCLNGYGYESSDDVLFGL